MSNLSHLLRTKIQNYHLLNEISDKMLLNNYYKRINRNIEKQRIENLEKMRKIYKNVYSKLDLVDLLMEKNKDIVKWRISPPGEGYNLFCVTLNGEGDPVIVSSEKSGFHTSSMISEKLGKSLKDIENITNYGGDCDLPYHTYDILKIMSKKERREFLEKISRNKSEFIFVRHFDM